MIKHKGIFYGWRTFTEVALCCSFEHLSTFYIRNTVRHIDVENFCEFPRVILHRIDEIFYAVVTGENSYRLMESRVGWNDFVGGRAGDVVCDGCCAGTSRVGENSGDRFENGFEIANNKKFDWMLVTNFPEFQFCICFREDCSLRTKIFTFFFVFREWVFAITAVKASFTDM